MPSPQPLAYSGSPTRHMRVPAPFAVVLTTVSFVPQIVLSVLGIQRPLPASPAPQPHANSGTWARVLADTGSQPNTVAATLSMHRPAKLARSHLVVAPQ